MRPSERDKALCESVLLSVSPRAHFCSQLAVTSSSWLHHSWERWALEILCKCRHAVLTEQTRHRVKLFLSLWENSVPCSHDRWNILNCYGPLVFLTPSAGLNLTWTLTLSPGHSTPVEGSISNTTGGGHCSNLAFRLRWRGTCLSIYTQAIDTYSLSF